MGTRNIDTPSHQIEVAVWIITYAYFVIPLTFLSAFLLLARQRMVAPAKYQYARVAREQTPLRSPSTETALGGPFNA